MKFAGAVCLCMMLCGLSEAQVSLSSTALRSGGPATLNAAGPAGSPLWLLADTAAGPAVWGGHTFDLALSPALVIVESPAPFSAQGALSATFTLDTSVISGTPLWIQLVSIDPAGPGDGVVVSNSVHRVVHPAAIDGLGASGTCTGASGTYLADDEVCTVNLGISFQFYGVDFTQVQVDSNGLLSFGSAVSDPLATAMGLGSKTGSIALIWADLDPSAPMPVGDPRNQIHIDRANGNHCRLTWQQVQRPGSAQESTASITFWSDHSITFEWGAVNGPCVVGMNALAGSPIALVDLSALSDAALPPYVGFAEQWNSGFDLSGSLLTLRADGAGGYVARMN